MSDRFSAFLKLPKRFVAATALLLVTNAPVWPQASNEGSCSGLLTKSSTGLKILEGESNFPCHIGDNAITAVSSVCIIGQRCEVKGVVEYCSDGKCSLIKNVSSVTRRLANGGEPHPKQTEGMGSRPGYRDPGGPMGEEVHADSSDNQGSAQLKDSKSPAGSESQPGTCRGILAISGGLFLWNEHEEGLCEISAKEERIVLKNCREGRECKVAGTVSYCPDSGECVVIDEIKYAKDVSEAHTERYSFYSLPTEIRQDVEDVRKSCREQNPDFAPADMMQGVIEIMLEDSPGLLVDNEGLCGTPMAGANCSNRGCDVKIWKRINSAKWQRIFFKHLHEKQIVVDPVSSQLKNMRVKIYAGDPNCNPPKDAFFSSGQTCDATVSYVRGRWRWDLVH